MSENLLKPVDDGLVMRSSQEYARDKLRIIDGYTQRMVTSMRERPWRAMFYIDLEAGPGKNLFPSGGDIESGSPLIGLGANYPFTHYRFIEIDKRNCDALKKRVASSELHRQAKVFHGDCNVLVDEITREIQEIDRPFIHGKWHSLNLAILDPEGLGDALGNSGEIGPDEADGFNLHLLDKRYHTKRKLDAGLWRYRENRQDVWIR